MQQFGCEANPVVDSNKTSFASALHILSVCPISSAIIQLLFCPVTAPTHTLGYHNKNMEANLHIVGLSKVQKTKGSILTSFPELR